MAWCAEDEKTICGLSRFTGNEVIGLGYVVKRDWR
ncbi:hypothetical protein SNOG_15473 [Parastagonospora nodorum SN15]|uniref:Uncharacterized protein n=1 Tax=Phaeosphaeria nodorum (strain SN15 / ATCC MYA-4574 / FGSC 10173) TaxID=321614 RepID=Q0TYD8_PHANO|nr:hypothetical protein SNOG_15473 [Parastagonospora nodorum SN15]EAT77138.1 hypothetical protein SNOG_15473 [Parastagonospora nodorum SN15]